MPADPENRSDDSVPKCKGCGSRNLQAVSTASVSVTYWNPLYASNGELVFEFSDTGFGEGERWRIKCEDCGRGMRTDLAPIDKGAVVRG